VTGGPAETPRRLGPADLDWVVDVTRRRRESLVPHAPRFWRPATDATERHRAFLGHLIDEPDAFTVRTDPGYVIAQRRGSVWLVDDAVVTEAGDWLTDGAQLLRHTQEHCGALRLVVPVFETRRMEAASRVGLTPLEHWWHRDLPDVVATVEAEHSEDPTIRVEGAAGRLVPAPPVYDPGGPVLLVAAVESASALSRIETEASRRGAPVSVVSQVPSDVRLAALLTAAGYVLTTAFCEAP
jgi:hypothetical protein